jgi:hypothetical protein
VKGKLVANQALTGILGIAIPGDDSHNSPYGVADQVLAQAINLLEAAIVAAIQTQAYVFAVDTGVANAYVAAFSPTPPTQVGTRVYIKCIHANTAASTLAITGFLAGAAKPITKNGTTALAGAEISANQIVQLVWDGTEWQMISQ